MGKIYVSKDIKESIKPYVAEIKKGKLVEMADINICTIDGMEQFDEYKDDSLFLSKSVHNDYKESCMAKAFDTRLDARKQSEIDKLIKKECVTL